jgi:hypothetical protein
LEEDLKGVVNTLNQFSDSQTHKQIPGEQRGPTTEGVQPLCRNVRGPTRRGSLEPRGLDTASHENLSSRRRGSKVPSCLSSFSRSPLTARFVGPEIHAES